MQEVKELARGYDRQEQEPQLAVSLFESFESIHNFITNPHSRMGDKYFNNLVRCRF